MKHHSETHIITNTVMKQSKGLHDSLKSENQEHHKEDHDGSSHRQGTKTSLHGTRPFKGWWKFC